MSIMYAQMGMAAGKAAFGFAAAQSSAKFQKAMQGYNNAMIGIQAATANNVTTLNEISAQDAAVRASVDLQQKGILSEGQADVAAGAAGVAGNSVDAVQQNLDRSLATANFARTERLRQQYIAFGQERRNTAMSKAMGTDNSVIPKPSGAAALIGFGSTLLQTYDNYQPEGDKLANLFVKRNDRLFT